MNNKLRPFHIAFPVRNLEETIDWYTKVLGCSIGRSSDKWVDFNLYGHQIVAHISTGTDIDSYNEVDGASIPVRHFGVILTFNQWKHLKDKLLQIPIDFIVKPQTRFKGLKGEQNIMFFSDPSGNALEFKSFKNDEMIFEN